MRFRFGIEESKKNILKKYIPISQKITNQYAGYSLENLFQMNFDFESLDCTLKNMTKPLLIKNKSTPRHPQLNMKILNSVV
jgi:hypothetical protein